MDQLKIIRILNSLIGIIFVIFIIWMLQLDLNRYWALVPTPTTSPRIWYIDDDLLILTFNSKGFWMLWAAIIDGIATIGWGYLALKMLAISKAKKRNLVKQVIISTLIAVFLARLIETIYIISETDLHLMLNVVTKFFLPLDAYSISLFNIFAVNVFLAEKLESNQKWATFSLVIGMAAIAVGFMEILTSIFPVLSSGATLVAGILLLAINLPFSLIIYSQIKRLIIQIGDLHDNYKNGVVSLKWMYIFFWLGITLMLLSIGIKGILPEMSYMVRTVKNVVYCILVYFGYQAFILPNKNPIK